MARMPVVSMTVLCLLLALAPQFLVAEGASLRAHTAERRVVSTGGDDDGDDGGDDGGAGGLAGALSSLMGGGGQSGGGGAGDDEDDPNMVDPNKKKKGAKKQPGVDLGSLESGLKNGGIGGLMGMLNAMRAAQSPADTHIKKGSNGEEMYDFRDLDDGISTTTERKPVVVHTSTLPPMPVVAVPRMPTISLPGRHGKLKGMQNADVKSSADESDHASGDSHKLVVWPPRPAVSPTVNVPQATAVAVSPGGASKVPASSLYQSLAMMRQNMDALLGQAAGGTAAAPPSSGASNGQLTAKLDQLSQTFTSEEGKMEKRLESLEDENVEFKKQLEEQAKEIIAAKQELNQAQKTNVRTTRTSNATEAPKYATKPWNVTFSVHLHGRKSNGPVDAFTIQVHPEWSPEGARRFQDMVQAGLLQDARFFRVVPRFMVQFGIPGTPSVAAAWVHKRIPDDRVKKSNIRGRMTFAKSGPNTRTTQMFINYGNNKFLDKQGFSPFAEVLGDGMEVVDKIQSKYRERPNQAKIQHDGNKYLMKHFPDLSFVARVDSTLTGSSQAASFVQDSALPISSASAGQAALPISSAGAGQGRRYGGIPTFYHTKEKMSD